MSGDEAKPRSRAGRTTRLRDFLLVSVLRPLVLAFWAFVIWGNLLIVLFLLRVLSAGWAAGAASLWPGADASAWAFLNLGCVGLALLVWIAAGTFLVLGRRASSEDAS